MPANTFLSDDDPNEILEYALPMARPLCEGAEDRTNGKLRCTFIDMVPVFEGHDDTSTKVSSSEQRCGV